MESLNKLPAAKKVTPGVSSPEAKQQIVSSRSKLVAVLPLLAALMTACDDDSSVAAPTPNNSFAPPRTGGTSGSAGKGGTGGTGGYAGNSGTAGVSGTAGNAGVSGSAGVGGSEVGGSAGVSGTAGAAGSVDSCTQKPLDNMNLFFGTQGKVAYRFGNGQLLGAPTTQNGESQTLNLHPSANDCGSLWVSSLAYDWIDNTDTQNGFKADASNYVNGQPTAPNAQLVAYEINNNWSNDPNSVDNFRICYGNLYGFDTPVDYNSDNALITAHQIMACYCSQTGECSYPGTCNLDLPNETVLKRQGPSLSFTDSTVTGDPQYGGKPKIYMTVGLPKK